MELFKCSLLMHPMWAKKKSIKPIKAQRNAKNLTEAAGTEGHGKSQCTSKSEEIYSTAASDRWKP